MPPNQCNSKIRLRQRCANTLHALIVRKVIGYGKYKVAQMKELEDKYKRSRVPASRCHSLQHHFAWYCRSNVYLVIFIQWNFKIIPGLQSVIYAIYVDGTCTLNY